MGVWIGIGVGTLVAVAAVLALLGNKSVRAEGVIDASPGEVWAVLADAPGYASWNPVLVRVEGEFREGETLKYGMAMPDGSVADVNATVTHVEAERELRQKGGIPLVLSFDNRLTLSPENGKTRVIQRESYGGIGVWFWDPSWYEGAYGRAISRLGERVEKRRTQAEPARGGE